MSPEGPGTGAPHPSAEVEAAADEGEPPTLLFIPLAALAVSGFFGIAFSPYLLVKAPLALIALSPLIRHLVAVAPLTDPIPFAIVAVLRLFAADPFLYMLGRRYGPKSLVWVKARSVVLGRAISIFEGIFRKAGLLLVFVTPGVAVCTLAGVVRMPAPRFVVTNLLGTISLVLLVRFVGRSFRSYIQAFVSFLELNLATFTLASVALTVLGWLYWRRRSQARLFELEAARADATNEQKQ